MATGLLDKTTISIQVAQELRRRILAGHYPQGVKLQQEQIAAELGVSRSPVREALGQLEAEGLVVLTPQKGAQVSPISRAEIAELFELRLLVEPHLIALAIPEMTEADLNKATSIISEMADISLDGWGDANWRLHEVLYAPAGRPGMLKLLRRTHETIGRYIRMQVMATNGRSDAHREHKLILDACRKRDVAKAVGLLRKHIEDAGRMLHPEG
ncbi:GntR family transcriptional regulator [Devosia sp. LjRoot16]|uniref:GntR family transcriptional regulator n=1 Tax=Devosia sp. LjRoot16 TaxID=3342271 RepID=UPI003ECCE100